MVDLVDILNIRNVACHVAVTSKKKALHQASRMLSDSLNATPPDQSPESVTDDTQVERNAEEVLNEVLSLIHI